MRWLARIFRRNVSTRKTPRTRTWVHARSDLGYKDVDSIVPDWVKADPEFTSRDIFDVFCLETGDRLIKVVVSDGDTTCTIGHDGRLYVVKQYGLIGKSHTFTGSVDDFRARREAVAARSAEIQQEISAIRQGWREVDAATRELDDHLRRQGAGS